MPRIVPITPSSFPTARSYLWLGLLWLAFVAYGSLAPFSFRPLSIEEARDEFAKVLDRPLRFASRSDLVVNVLLMVPLAFCLMGAMGVDRSRVLSLGDLFLVLPACVATSFVVEFLQVYLPNRTSALGDIVAQGIGAGAGVLLWLFVGQKATDWARWVWAPPLPVRLDARLLPAYLVVLALVHLVPFDLVTSPVDLYRKFRDGQVNLVPFRYPAADPFSYVEGRLLSAVYFFLLGLMLPGLPWEFWKDRRQRGQILGWCLVLVGAVTGLKLLAVSRSFDVTDLLVGTLACWIGWEISLAVRQAVVAGTRWPIVRVASWFGLLLWLALVTFVNWQPFDWDFTLAEERLTRLPLVPFADVMRGDELTAMRNLVQKLVLFLPLGVLVTTWRTTQVPLAWVPAVTCGAIVALTLEVGQLFLQERTAALTDVYFETAGALLGSIVTRRTCVSAPSLARLGQGSLGIVGRPVRPVY